MEEGGRACDSSSKSRGKGEESVDGCQFAWYTKRRPGLHVLSKIEQKDPPYSHRHVGTGPHVNETWCVISRAKFDLAALARCAALVIDLYFFSGVPISFDAQLTGTVRGEDDSRDSPRSWQYASKCLLISSQ